MILYVSSYRNGNFIFISEYNIPSDKFLLIWEKETKTTIDKNAKDRNIKRIEKLFII